MTTWVRLLLSALIAAHGLLHLLGAAKGLGLAQVAQLKQPISTGSGFAWAMASVMVLLAAAALAARVDWWWTVALLAALLSQAVIVTSWQDAKAGTALNVVLLLAAAYGFAAHGPMSYDAEWKQRSAAALTLTDAPTGVVTEEDLAALPAPLAGYLRRTGAVGAPRVASFSATFHGRIRSGADQAWMPFTGQQVNTYGSAPRREFLLHASRSGLPVTVLHVFEDGRATMRGRLLSAIPVMDASGPEMDRGETVTLFNDMVVLSPAALIDAPVTWTTLSASKVEGTFTLGSESVAATLTFDRNHDLVDFASDDRLRASSDALSFTRQTWSTPVSAYRQFGSRRVAAEAEALWHAPEPEGQFTYAELTIDTITFNPTVSEPRVIERAPGQASLPPAAHETVHVRVHGKGARKIRI